MAKRPGLYFFRDSGGNEVDLIYQDGSELIAIEIKSTSTFSPYLLHSLKKICEITKKISKSFLVYNGEQRLFEKKTTALNFKDISLIFLD